VDIPDGVSRPPCPCSLGAVVLQITGMRERGMDRGPRPERTKVGSTGQCCVARPRGVGEVRSQHQLHIWAQTVVATGCGFVLCLQLVAGWGTRGRLTCGPVSRLWAVCRVCHPWAVAKFTLGEPAPAIRIIGQFQNLSDAPAPDSSLPKPEDRSES